MLCVSTEDFMAVNRAATKAGSLSIKKSIICIYIPFFSNGKVLVAFVMLHCHAAVHKPSLGLIKLRAVGWGQPTGNICSVCFTLSIDLTYLTCCSGDSLQERGSSPMPLWRVLKSLIY